MSILRAATRIFCGLGLLVAPLAAAAQPADDEARDYRTYRTTGTEKAPTNKSAEQEAREEAAWHSNTLLCERGNLAACYKTARAYELGEGTAQSRPIAAILYTEGCAQDYAESCRRLGGLADVEVDDAGKEEAAELFSKACSLGSLRACTSYAYALSSGRGMERDEASAAALLRETCSAGEVEACRMQAAELLKPERGFYDHSEGISLLNFGCDNGYPAACSDLLRLKFDPAVYSVLRPRIETLSLACAAQSGLDCLTLADHAFVGNEMPMDRDYAYRMYELSCALLEQNCFKSEAMLAEPELLQKCHDGDEVACGDLGEIYMRQDLILQNQEKGRAYLSQACDAAQGKACYLLAQAMIDETYTPSADSGPDAFQYLDLSCNLGHFPACNRLARELDYGYRIAQDKVAAAALYEATCDQGDAYACDELQKRFWSDPAAPLALAGANYIPPIGEDDTGGLLALLPEEERKQWTGNCTATSVSFRGKVYSDRICPPTGYVLGGYSLRPGQAPWQALLWRPGNLSGQNLSSAQRVLCGGSVIKAGWILTAAHCLTDQGSSVMGAGHRIRLGVHNPRANEGVSFPIEAIFPHPSYTRSDFAYDIALVKYDAAAGDQGEAVNSISRIDYDKAPVNSRSIEEGATVYTYGWGWTEAANSTSTTELRGAALKLASIEECTAITGYRFAALCAQGDDGEQACSGDSGGPLITYNDDDRVPRVIGIVSAGRKCGTVGEKSRYTRVGTVRSWIARTMAANP